MADLVAIGYPDEATAEAAADEARRLAADLIIQPDAIAVIVRDKDGSYHVHTSHHTVGAGATWGMFWGFLFGLLFFIPVFGMAVGAGLGALMGKLAKTSIDKQFQDQVRDMLQPGTSALFLMLEKVTPDKAVEAMSKYGGTVLKTSLSKDDEKELQEALHGARRPRSSPDEPHRSRLMPQGPSRFGSPLGRRAVFRCPAKLLRSLRGNHGESADGSRAHSVTRWRSLAYPWSTPICRSPKAGCRAPLSPARDEPLRGCLGFKLSHGGDFRLRARQSGGSGRGRAVRVPELS